MERILRREGQEASRGDSQPLEVSSFLLYSSFVIVGELDSISLDLKWEDLVRVEVGY